MEYSFIAFRVVWVSSLFGGGVVHLLLHGLGLLHEVFERLLNLRSQFLVGLLHVSGHFLSELLGLLRVRYTLEAVLKTIEQDLRAENCPLIDVHMPYIKKVHH